MKKLTCYNITFNFCRGSAADGYHWPHEFPLQDSYLDAIPFMKFYYPHDILYETTLPIEPTSLSIQGYQLSVYICVIISSLDNTVYPLSLF